ncbi:hypothetical protein Sste5346_006413 [Sporothrix stenoceras]|uniref:FAM192A/Fyv6 N-terminal domain-containing protein n=1 Tax=Sporothrix stenoceras TaxID=5173 RepID=A0ABR3YZV4_9PEZI
MSSRFVSGGAIDAATGDAVDLAKVKESMKSTSTATTSTATTSTTQSSTPLVSSARQAEWAAVEKELEADRQRRAEARKALGSGAQEKSLYDVLQANKAAKQAAFEEAHGLKNQFRALDEDEIEFLEGVEEDARREAARVAAETAAGLDAFRAAQTKGGGDAGGDKSDDVDNDDTVEKLVDDSAWAVGRKRKRRGDKTDKAGAFPNLKRKGSSAAEKDKEEPEAKKETTTSASSTAKEPAKASPKPIPATAPKAKPALGLVAYGSDDDNDSD